MTNETEASISLAVSDTSVPGATTMQKARIFITSHYELRYNEVTERTEFRKNSNTAFKVLKTRDVHSMRQKLDLAFIKISKADLESLLASEFVVSYDPFIRYLTALPTWDGETDYILELADSVVTTNQDFWRDAFKRWFVTLVKSLIKEDVINHQMLILSGGQGIGKTTWILGLIPPIWKDYIYSGKIDPKNRDSLIHLKQCVLINMDELSDMRKMDASELKALITNEVIVFRKVYGHDQDKYIRRASFAGSVNSKDFLNDPTGTRRFLCFEVSKINFDQKQSLDRVYSQAFALANDATFKHWFDGKDIELIEQINKGFSEHNIIEDVIQEKLLPGQSGSTGSIHRSCSELARVLFSDLGIPLNQQLWNKLSAYFKKNGFEKSKKNGKDGYWVKPINVDTLFNS